MLQIAEDFRAMFHNKGDKMVSVWPVVSHQLIPLLRTVKKESKLVAAVLSESPDLSAPGILYLFQFLRY